MLPRSNSTVYSRPNSRGGAKDSDLHMRAYTLSREMTRLEYEKKMAEMKIVRVEKRLNEIQNEIHEINTHFREEAEIVEMNVIPKKPKEKHITFEY